MIQKPSTSPLSWLLRFAGIAAVFFVLFLVNEYLFPQLNGYHRNIVINVGIAIILAASLNLINGITGQFSLGHAGFMAIGAYVGAFFTKEIGKASPLADPLVFFLGLLAGALAAGLAGLIVGMPSLRLRGDYLAIVTLGFNQIIISIIRNISAVGGASGYIGIDKFTTFAWTFGAVFLCLLSIRNLANSQLGRAMRAVRDDEIAAEASGINTTQIKVIAFVYSAMWAGVAGALQAHYIQYANPNDFTFLKSVEVVVMVVLGGLGSITGSALAAIILKVTEEILRDVPGVFWTSITLIALATYWGYARHRESIKKGFRGVIGWLATPAISLFIVLVLYFNTYAWLIERKGSLRYIIYSIILIVLMLLRPQGLLGRAEWSMNALRARFRRREVLS